MKFRVIKTELIYPKEFNSNIVIHEPIEVDDLEEYRKKLREGRECERILFTYEELP